ncbi:MAG: hypothetical protein A3G33_01710 [Omnitrophica bacterium RIFCSPLOWO2_12_FULL_44_17]|uniref:DUF2157 domain-containing protein n=1 Tax=Candidatus Danuiimicrobium aquiferis TaxID=1801832 RepID=A0A1G1KVB2_9BACT|nr:MAG: hypothetical protein A3B72_00940 [Omnitrophica bacterium RIFCSPHIGHO2_02_FULL_45_28]OGW92182.1 MAG: hypothetical protein A3E74_08695 [Omnitrophica bacterium RIFCSPHIGHO2_12_FULL_44_12]OGW96831.1 MAG: hypothetical protein A3G33_01710 [Omnitrophica bacterium RIFCSPLOWO2_12_FULL_44_17]OGX03832.1 MAG: hypothetical protein A3J12_09610 [Omnitrophica bacterium RIFCSPLOWO2_02_FULL_44_11]
MEYRVVLYELNKWLNDEDVLRTIESVGVPSRKEVLNLIKRNRVLYIKSLEESKARALADFFKGRGIDCDLEPMELDDTVRNWILEEGKKWLKRSFVYPHHLVSIWRNYGLEAAGSVLPPVKAKDPKSLIKTILTIGAVLIGLGIILFIASNWQRFPNSMKIIGSTVSTLAFLHAGYYVREKSFGPKHLTNALFLISIFSIGSTIALISQIYHVEADSYILPLIWGFLALPVFFFLDYFPAIYIASGLWLLANVLYQSLIGTAPWFYPLLLLGFLLPYSARKKDENFFNVNLVFLMVALSMTTIVKDFVASSIWVLSLTYLLKRKKTELYEYLVMAGFFIWNINFVQNFGRFPNLLYLVILFYFVKRALSLRSNEMMIVSIFNGLYWLSSFYWQAERRFNLTPPDGSDIILYLMSVGMIFYGAGKRILSKSEWKTLANFLCYGGLVLVALMVYVMSFRFYSSRDNFFQSIPYLFSTLCFTVLSVYLALPSLVKDFQTDPRKKDEIGIYAFTAGGLILTVLVPPYAGIHVVLFNLILFFMAFMFMTKGHREQRIAFYNWGIALFIVLIISRYTDTLWAFLSRSIFFILGGVFLICWAIFIDREKKRMGKAQSDD